MDSVRKHFKGNPFHPAAFVKAGWIEREATSLDGVAKKRPSLEILALKPCQVRVIGPCLEPGEFPVEGTLGASLRCYHKGSIDGGDDRTPLVCKLHKFVS